MDRLVRQRPRPVVRRATSLPAGFATCGEFGWRHQAHGVEIVHRLDAATISDSTMIAGLLPLVDLGVIAGQDAFEAAAVGVIRTSATTEARGWAAFYDNSLQELRSGDSPFSPIHRRARSLILGDSVLEVGSCFGFFALQCAEDGRQVQACDISAGAVDLLIGNSRRRGAPVHAVVGDATDLPFADDSVDTVTLIHLLEHLDEWAATTALTEALRVARLRVVVAVPYEENPSEHFGHLVRLSEADLRGWAGTVGHAGADYLEDHGGWLILTPPG
ncbi:Ubiquinone/menaquinone biosynthesis C-methyltransferase UbiE [Gordonia insulae]|uniref:Ubiquinone/menaquinone biosynthesis C-methyltransferase UbiE n=1 Tax=Gordonia insulae TaxID=2420509 RepID=A0A3G8JKK1_9ACTN|nr:Ubiquinone/menaquinone biosynthesis C-methyltransferase UbiE [Gordonia insulae]